jgi:hypothetical protein
VICRGAEPRDRERLQEFVCCDGERSYEVDVQTWIQSESWDWLLSGSQDDDRQLLLFEEDASPDLIAVAAHEADFGNRFVNAIAVATAWQGNHLGYVVMATVLDDCADRCPGGVATWKVDPHNLRSVDISNRSGAEYTHPPELKPLLLFVLDLPERD